jgi:site-specific DNA-methyltransferase (adenine-specific)
MNKSELYYGDNINILREMVKDESVDLCYIDPPFNSKRNYNQIYNNIGKDDKAQAIAFTDTWEWDKAAAAGLREIKTNARRLMSAQTVSLVMGLQHTLGNGSLFAYIVSMTLRLVEIHRVLKKTGSFYLHCDPTASHYLKLVLDSIFCKQGGEFQNEIIWHYRRWTGKAKKFQALHDVIFFYTKSGTYTFNEPYTPYTDKSLKRKQHHHTRIKDGDVYVTSIDEKGVRDNDVWQIPILNSQSKERLGYPTQKPEALLEKIITASSNEGDTVLDAYCGCGTTVAVAQMLKRRWIGIDITYHSISLITKRLTDKYGDEIINKFTAMGKPADWKSAEALALKKDDRTRKEFEKWAILTYSNNRAMINEQKGADGGIDGRAVTYDEKLIILSAKSGRAGIHMVRELHSVMMQHDAAAGILITLHPPTRSMASEAAAIGFYQNEYMVKAIPKLKIVTVEDVLNNERLEIPLVLDTVKKAQAVDLSEQIGLS